MESLSNYVGLFDGSRQEIDNSLPFYTKSLQILSTIAVEEEVTDVMAKTPSLIENMIKFVLLVPKGLSRKCAVRVLYHISESIWIRGEIAKTIRSKFTEEQQMKFITLVMTDRVDDQEKEMMDELLKNTDLVLHQYKPGKAWYDAKTFEFTKLLEDNWQVIKEEALAAVVPENTVPWPEKFLYKKGWEVLGFYAFKNKIELNCQRCPKTAAILEKIPGVSTALFSCLQPRCHIKPHVGYYQYSEKILRVHLGIVVPKGCTLRVNGEGREWEEGKVLVFDDTFRHEAWNPSEDTLRIVFMLDVDFVGNVADRNPEFYEKSRKQAELGEDALISKDLIEVLQSVGASTNNLQERPVKYL